MKTQSPVEFAGNRRFHVGLAVTNLERSRLFYESLLGVPPSKQRPGYVKFEPTEPSVNLTLNEVPIGDEGRKPATHYGIQVKSVDAVQQLSRRLQEAGLNPKVEEETTCCYALQHKVWVVDPDENAWEVFVVLEADTEQAMGVGSTCCQPVSKASTSTCC